MKTNKTAPMETKTLQWLRLNHPAPLDVIAGHLIGPGDQPRARIQRILKTLMASGLVEIVDTGARPYLWRPASSRTSSSFAACRANAFGVVRSSL